MRREPLALLVSIALLASVAAIAVPAAPTDWTQWRGARRDGISAVTAPAAWPAALSRGWSVSVGSGHSSPVVSDGTIYQFSRRGGQEGLAALRLADGAELWWSGYDAPYRMHPAARAHGDGPKSTPVVAGDRVFTLGIDGVVSAFARADGAVLWRQEFGDRHAAASPIYGAAASPIVVGGRVVVHVGGAGDGALTAFDPETGATVWALSGDGPGYASPVLVEIDGVRQLVTQTDAHVVAVDPADGTPLWRLPFTTDYDQNSVTPVAYGETLILGGLDRGLFAVRPERNAAGSWVPIEVWRTGEVSTYMSTPVLVGDRLLGFSHRRSGQRFGLDPDSGEVVWAGTGREGENAALVGLGEHVLFLTDDAILRVVSASGAGDVLASYEVAGSPTWAHPVPVDGGLLVKDLEGLTLWRWD